MARSSRGRAIGWVPQKVGGWREGTSQPARLFPRAVALFPPREAPTGSSGVVGQLGGPEHTGEGAGGEPVLPKPARDSAPSPQTNPAAPSPPRPPRSPGHTPRGCSEPHPINRLSSLPTLLLAPRAERGSRPAGAERRKRGQARDTGGGGLPTRRGLPGARGQQQQEQWEPERKTPSCREREVEG